MRVVTIPGVAEMCDRVSVTPDIVDIPGTGRGCFLYFDIMVVPQCRGYYGLRSMPRYLGHTRL